MQFGVLGPLEVATDDGRAVDLGSPKLRALLVLLLTDPGRAVAVDRINDTLWAGEPPASATGTLQSYVSQLRRILEPDRAPREPARVLLTRPPGYLVVAGPESLDVLRFEQLAADGERLLPTDPEAADRALLTGLALWRGEPFAELGEDEQVRADRARLGELRVVALERHVEAMLAAGRPDTAVPELERLVAVHPLRERLWHSLMLAMYRTGRQADALRAFTLCRERLRDELGIDPGPRLRALEQAVLTQDPALDGPVRAAPAPVTVMPAVVPAAAPAQAPSTDADGTREVPPVGGGFVGRAAELATLRERLRAVVAGGGSVVLVTGEAGIGKTRLTEETTAAAAELGVRVAWSRCADEAAMSALHPWAQVLQALDDTPGADALITPGPVGADADADRVALFERVAQALAAAASRRPLLVVLDDLHGADPASMHLLRFLVARIARVPLMIVATLRDGAEERTDALVHTLAELVRERTVTRLRLAGLGTGEVEELLGHRGVDGGQVGALAPLLRDRTEGNPFFLVELIALMRSEHRLGGGAGDVPESVRDVLDRRLARLPPDTRALLTLASVIGRDFPLDVLEAAAELDADRIDTLIEAAVLAGLVVESGEGWAWRFSHDLVRETIVAGLTRMQRARLHRQIARGIEALPPRSRRDRLDALAHHSYLAGPFAQEGAALRYAVDAADAARRRFGFGTAAGHMARAIELLAVDDTDPRSRRLRQEMLVTLGRDRRAAGDLVGAQEALLEGVELARAAGDTGAAADAASVFGGVALWNWRVYGRTNEQVVGILEELLAGVELAGAGATARRAALLGTLGCELCYSSRRTEGMAHAREAVRIARTLGDPALLGRTLNNLYLAGWVPGGEAERRAALEEALAQPLPVHTETVARLHRAALALRHAELDLARSDLDRAHRLATEVGLLELRAQVIYQEVGHATLRGAWHLAEKYAEEAWDLHRTVGLWGAQWCRIVQRMTVHWGLGTLDGVLDELLAGTTDPEFAGLRPVALLALVEAGESGRALRLVRETDVVVPVDWSTDFLRCAWGEVAAALGTPDPARVYAELLPQAGELVVAGTANVCWGSVHGVLGRLALRLGDHDAARAHLRRAVAEDGRLGADPWRARAQGGLDELDTRA